VGTGKRGRMNREGKGGQIWLMYFVFVYEKRTMKLIKIIREEEG
jgi:hypothetical protein